MDKYRVIRVLGEGAFGKVLEATNSKENNERVAVKQIKSSFTSWNECMKQRELKALKSLRHPRIVRLREMILEQQCLYFVFEFVNSNLADLLSHRRKDKARGGRPLAPREMQRALFQLLDGLCFMHKLGFFHRDIKPDNLLCDPDGGNLKIADFGLAREIRARPPYTEYVSTRWYRAPEVILGDPAYSSPVDLWACGCILVELYSLQPLFPGTSAGDQMSRVVNLVGAPSDSKWPAGLRLAGSRQPPMRIPRTHPTTLQDVFTQTQPAFAQSGGGGGGGGGSGNNGACGGTGWSSSSSMSSGAVGSGASSAGCAQGTPGNAAHLGAQGMSLALSSPFMGALCSLSLLLMELDPAARPSAWQALQHPFFSGYDDKHPNGIDSRSSSDSSSNSAAGNGNSSSESTAGISSSNSSNSGGGSGGGGGSASSTTPHLPPRGGGGCGGSGWSSFSSCSTSSCSGQGASSGSGGQGLDRVSSVGSWAGCQGEALGNVDDIDELLGGLGFPHSPAASKDSRLPSFPSRRDAGASNALQNDDDDNDFGRGSGCGSGNNSRDRVGNTSRDMMSSSHSGCGSSHGGGRSSGGGSDNAGAGGLSGLGGSLVSDLDGGGSGSKRSSSFGSTGGVGSGTQGKSSLDDLLEDLDAELRKPMDSSSSSSSSSNVGNKAPAGAPPQSRSSSSNQSHQSSSPDDPPLPFGGAVSGQRSSQISGVGSSSSSRGSSSINAGGNDGGDGSGGGSKKMEANKDGGSKGARAASIVDSFFESVDFDASSDDEDNTKKDKDATASRVAKGLDKKSSPGAARTRNISSSSLLPRVDSLSSMSSSNSSSSRKHNSSSGGGGKRSSTSSTGSRGAEGGDHGGGSSGGGGGGKKSSPSKEGKFSEEELAALVAAVELYPVALGLDRNVRWKKVAHHVGNGRSKKECFDAFKDLCSAAKEKQKQKKFRARDAYHKQQQQQQQQRGSSSPSSQNRTTLLQKEADGDGLLPSPDQLQPPSSSSSSSSASEEVGAGSEAAAGRKMGSRVRRSEQFAPPSGAFLEKTEGKVLPSLLPLQVLPPSPVLAAADSPLQQGPAMAVLTAVEVFEDSLEDFDM